MFTLDLAALEQGGILTLFGMGVVFAFLALLIAFISLMMWLFRNFPSGEDEEVAPSRGGDEEASGDEELAAVAGALAHHRG